MDAARTRPILAAATGIALTAFLTAGVLYLLLLRIGDPAGARWAGRVALTAATATVVTTAFLTLSAHRDGTEPSAHDPV
jgi:hypothetical protein